MKEQALMKLCSIKYLNQTLLPKPRAPAWALLYVKPLQKKQMAKYGLLQSPAKDLYFLWRCLWCNEKIYFYKNKEGA